MPGFLYTIILLSLLGWGLWTKLLLTTRPDSPKNILLFLAVFLLSLGLTLSFPVYIYFYKKAPEFTNTRKIYRKALKLGFFFACGAAAPMAMKAFGVLTLLNAGLFLLLYLMALLSLKKQQ